MNSGETNSQGEQVRINSLEVAAKYALERMEDHERGNAVSLGYDCGMSLLRDALGVTLTEKDERNLLSIGYETGKKQRVKDLQSLSQTLSEQECAFVEAVFRHPDSKYPGGPELWDTIDMDCGVWVRPEQRGFVVSTGTYKWKPVDELRLGMVVQ